MSNFACMVLAAGKGSRMKSAIPKTLHKIGGRSLLRHVQSAAENLAIQANIHGLDIIYDPNQLITIIGPDMEKVAQEAAPWRSIIQPQQLGTGDAVRIACQEGLIKEGKVLILYGDTPLITSESLARMLRALDHEDRPAVVVAAMSLSDPFGYGRLITDGKERVRRIVEERAATDTEKEITLCNGGLMACDAARLPVLLDLLERHQDSGEYYLTDIVGHAIDQGWVCRKISLPAEELMGVNSRAQLATAQGILQNRLRQKLMDQGVTLLAPETVYLSWDTKIGRDSVIYPHLYCDTGVEIGNKVEVLGFCHLAGCRIEDKAQIGPFARLRPQTHIGGQSRIGNFVEVKNASLAAGVKANHLSYLGDATIGENSNIGAGTVICNYDGVYKYHTQIGKESFIGSNSSLIAPVQIGNQAVIGAGSVISDDVPDGALALARTPQMTKSGIGKKLRGRKKRH